MISPLSPFNTFLAASGSSTASRLARVQNVENSYYQPDTSDPGDQSQQRTSRREDAVALRLGERAESNSLPTYSAKGQLTAASSEGGAQSNQAKEDEQEQAEQEQERAEEEQVRELKERDREVRNHEQAHKSALGGHSAGGISYEYTQGPDGGRYAVGGEVPVDTSEEASPEETIDKMQTIKRAALAPKEPSSADRAVAAQASQKEAEARAELLEEKKQEQVEGRSEEGPGARQLGDISDQSPASRFQGLYSIPYNRPGENLSISA